ncbi:MAG: hypothetical protein ACSHX0_10545 [Akkermansiaceae bacterium]
MPNPLGGLDASERSIALEELSKFNKIKFHSTLTKIKELLQTDIHLVHIIAHFSFYDHLTIPAFRRKKSSTSDEMRPLEQGHIEMLQALTLSQPEGVMKEFLDQSYQEFLNDLREDAKVLTNSWAMSRFGEASDGDNWAVIEFFRTRTAGIRNWGDTNQVFVWLEEMFSPKDAILKARYGITFSTLIQTVRKMLSIVEDRINDDRTQLGPVIRAKSNEAAVSQYLKFEDHTQELREEGFERMMALPVGLEEMKNLLMHFHEVNLWRTFVFKKSDFNSWLDELEAEGLNEIMKKWSICPNGLKNQNLEHLMMNNPIWSKPVVDLGAGMYFWPLLHVFQSFGIEMLTSLVSQADKEKFERDVKSDFCEKKVATLFRAWFPCAEVYTSNFFRIDGTKFENDCCVIVDRYCFVIEVKSGGLTDSAKRGSILSLSKGIGRLLGEGATQAARFIDALQGGLEISDCRGSRRDLDASQVTSFVPIVVSFEHLGEMAANKNTLVKAGIITSQVLQTLCFCLPDLERVLEILPSVSQRIHYLTRRSEIESNFRFKGDELDLLTFYLKTGFSIGEAEFDQDEELILTGISKTELDDFILDAEGVEPRPTRYLTRRWKLLLARIEERRFPGWTRAISILLSVDRECMDGAEEQIRAVFESLKVKPYEDGDNNIFLCTTGPARNKIAIAFTIGEGLDSPQRRNLTGHALDMVEGELGRVDCVIFSIDPSIPELPYLSFAMVEAGKWPE